MSKATVGIDNVPLKANQDSEVVGPSTLAKPVLPDRKLTSEWEQAKHQVQLACQRLHDLELVICPSTASRDSENLIHGSSMDSQLLQTMNHASKMTSLSQTGVNVKGHETSHVVSRPPDDKIQTDKVQIKERPQMSSASGVEPQFVVSTERSTM